MKIIEVYSCRDLQEAYLVKNMLDEHNIVCEIKNEHLQGAIGEVAVGIMTAPSIIVNENEAEESRKLIDAFVS